jgi:hypothetical protein
MYVYLGSLITNLSELAAGHPSGGIGQQIFYFAGMVVTVLITLYVTRLSRRALSSVEKQGLAAAPGEEAHHNTEATT